MILSCRTLTASTRDQTIPLNLDAKQLGIPGVDRIATKCMRLTLISPIHVPAGGHLMAPQHVITLQPTTPTQELTPAQAVAPSAALPVTQAVVMPPPITLTPLTTTAVGAILSAALRVQIRMQLPPRPHTITAQAVEH